MTRLLDLVADGLTWAIVRLAVSYRRKRRRHV